jgi:hypothetical protein
MYFPSELCLLLDSVGHHLIPKPSRHHQLSHSTSLFFCVHDLRASKTHSDKPIHELVAHISRGATNKRSLFGLCINNKRTLLDTSRCHRADTFNRREILSGNQSHTDGPPPPETAACYCRSRPRYGSQLLSDGFKFDTNWSARSSAPRKLAPAQVACLACRPTAACVLSSMFAWSGPGQPNNYQLLLDRVAGEKSATGVCPLASVTV